MTPAVVVMGVSGSGKSTVGAALAERLGVPFIEGDALHSAHNVGLMAAGTPLTDEDRREWLATVAERLRQGQARGGVVVSCSALKRSYRDQLRAAAPALRFIHLAGESALLAERMQQRAGHYMPASLLASQLATLEPPQRDESALEFSITEPVAAIVAAACRHLETFPA